MDSVTLQTPEQNRTIADGDVNGRNITVAEQADIPIDTSGTATHIGICDGSNVLLVTASTGQAVTSGNTTSVPAFAHTISDAS